MVKVARINTDLTANSAQFDKTLVRARGTLAREGRNMSRNAESFNKRVSSSFRRAAQSAAAFEGPLGGIAGRLSGLASIATSTGVALGGALLVLSGGILTIGKAAKVADRFEGSMNRINAVLKATRGASAQSAEGIREFSEELARSTLASVEGVEAAAAKLLTFRRISGDTFKRTLILAQDLAATGFGSLSDNVTQLGKALEDPVRNLGALTRNGVSFSDAQRKVINSLVETNRAAEAQAIILDAIALQVGGAGGAEGGEISKGLDVLSQDLDDFFLALDKATGGSDAFARAINQFGRGIQNITNILNPEKATLVDQLADASEELFLLQMQASEEIEFLKTRPGTAAEAEEIVAKAIEQQQAIVDALAARIAGEEKAAQAIEATAKAEQDKIQAEFEAAKIEKARVAAEKLRLKEAERQEKAIQASIKALKIETNALEGETTAVRSNVLSFEEAAIAREVMIRQQQLGVEAGTEEAQIIDILIRKRAKLRQLLDLEVSSRKRAAQVIAENKTEVENLNDELRELNELRAAGLLNEQQFQRAVERTNEKIKELDESNQRLENTIKTVAAAANDAFADFVLGAKSASDAARNFGLSLARSLLQETTGELTKSIIGPLVSSLFGGLFADGGRPPINRVSVVGEKGPELFVPDTAGTIIPNNQLGNGGGGTTIFADMRGASVEAVQRLEAFVAQINGSIEPRAVNAVVNESQRNPGMLGVS